ncbi:hypothetical protein [Ornithinimicrobium sp. INDO-MA30-4]|nr:hypothetical protein [Ornithinimicrobium sp. INDO-MA30-4]UJH70581.1 hypothetical protein L0A91_16315 [Ornithinimicrobium sp. INDO-MA30-4]
MDSDNTNDNTNESTDTASSTASSSELYDKATLRLRPSATRMLKPTSKS